MEILGFFLVFFFFGTKTYLVGTLRDFSDGSNEYLDNFLE